MFTSKWDCLLLMFNHLYPSLSPIVDGQVSSNPMVILYLHWLYQFTPWPVPVNCTSWFAQPSKMVPQNKELAAWLLIWLICIIIGKSISMKIQKQHHREWVKHMSSISTRFHWHKRPPSDVNSVADHAVSCSHSPGGSFCRLHSEWLKIYIWANYNNSLTWIKAIWGWFPLLTMIPVRSQWGRYNLPRYISRPITGVLLTSPNSLCGYNWLIGVTYLIFHFLSGKIHYFDWAIFNSYVLT